MYDFADINDDLTECFLKMFFVDDIRHSSVNTTRTVITEFFRKGIFVIVSVMVTSHYRIEKDLSRYGYVMVDDVI